MRPAVADVLCRTRLWHDWRTFSNPDGDRCRACSVCGREQATGGSNTIGA